VAATAASASAASVAACSPGAGPAATGAAAAPTGAGSAPRNTSFGPLKQINAGVLNIGYAEAGPANGAPVILLHGWPYDIHSYVDVGAADVIAALWPERCKALVSVSGYLIINLDTNLQPLPPAAELGWWYQYYFATERGLLGYQRNTHDFNKLIWKIASPKWNFDDATFDRTAASFNNPDHVGIVIHNYRWRLSLVKGDPQYQSLEQKLSGGPVVTVPLPRREPADRAGLRAECAAGQHPSLIAGTS
jgi:pimeloyl-ACP methyl ester carboxylesterase